MSFTTYQILAFIGGFAGMIITITIAYLEGRRSYRAEMTELRATHRTECASLRHQLDRATHEHTLSRLNAAQAIEAMTEEADQRVAEMGQLREEIADKCAWTLFPPPAEGSSSSSSSSNWSRRHRCCSRYLRTCTYMDKRG